MVEVAINLYTELIKLAVPICIVFEVCNMLTASFLRVAFGGKLWFGR